MMNHCGHLALHLFGGYSRGLFELAAEFVEGLGGRGGGVEGVLCRFAGGLA